jgi:hypothetical protein
VATYLDRCLCCMASGSAVAIKARYDKGGLVVEAVPGVLRFEPLARRDGYVWQEEDDVLWLLTPDEFLKMPDGLILTSIMGKTVVKGVDTIDMDTRFGLIAFGVRESQLEHFAASPGEQASDLRAMLEEMET